MTAKTLGPELRVLDAMNNSGLWMTWTTQRHEKKGSRYYEQLRVVDDMNDSESWEKGSGYYEQLNAMVDMNDFGSWA